VRSLLAQGRAQLRGEFRPEHRRAPEPWSARDRRFIVFNSSQRRERFLSSVLARAATVAFGASLLLAVVASSAPQGIVSSAKAPKVTVIAQARAAFIKAMSAHATAVSGGKWVLPGLKRSSAVTGSNVSVTSVPSVNWSGYADVESSSSTRFSSVSGRWILPGVTCLPAPYQNQDAFLAQWVGLDGATASSPTVEQLGTAAQCYEGVLYYYVWYEMYPNNTVEEGLPSCINNNVDCAQPGDQISASVSVTPGASGENNYTLTLNDNTTPGNDFSVTQQCAATTCLNATAEWIVERPAFPLPFGPQILPMADFSRALFEQGSAVSGEQRSSIAGFKGGPVDDVEMLDDSMSYYLDCVGQQAPPGTLLTASPNQCATASPFPGGAFSITWDSSF
jgi:Peptidase A4 family